MHKKEFKIASANLSVQSLFRSLLDEEGSQATSQAVLVQNPPFLVGKARKETSKQQIEGGYFKSLPTHLGPRNIPKKIF